MRLSTIVLPLLFASIALVPATNAFGHGDREPREVRESHDSHDQRDLDRQIRDTERRQLDAAREQEKARLDAERDTLSATSEDSGSDSESGSNSGSSNSNSDDDNSGSNSGSSNSGSDDDNSGSNSGSSNSGSDDDNSGSNSGSSNSGSDDDDSGSNSGSSNSGSDDDEDSDDSDDSDGDDDASVTREQRIDIETDTEGRERRRGELLARGGRDLSEKLRAAGFEPLSLRHLSNLDQSIARVRIRAGSNIDADRRFLLGIAGIDDAEPNYVFRLSGGAPAQTGATSVLGTQPTAATNAADAIRIGVVDTGADAAAPGLQEILGRARAFGGHYTPRTHGTHVAQILAREGIQVEIADVFQTDTQGAPVATAESIARGIDWLASRRLPVINISITGPRSDLLEDVVARAIARGTIIVAAAGNDGPGAPPVYPAAFRDVIGVTAVDAEGRVYRRANRGEHVDFAAFGVRVPINSGGGRTEYISGTSYASPLVAAAIARGYRHARPDAVPAEVTALRGRVVDLGDRGRDPVFGWGAISTQIKLRSR